MRYPGGKTKVAPWFSPVLSDALKSRGGVFLEPFVGGFNVVPHLDGVDLGFCGDVHPGLICLYKAVQSGWLPPSDVPERMYAEIKERADWTNPLTAFVAFACSFAGKEWGGYARGEGRNFADEGRRHLVKSANYMRNIHFYNGCFSSVPPLGPSCVIYLDPPYKDTLEYSTGAFDHNKLWDWVDCQRASGAEVFLSEFTLPDDSWEVVWTKKRKVTVGFSRNVKTEILARRK